MEKTKVVFNRSGEVGRYWGYTAWYATSANRSMTAELIDGNYTIFGPGDKQKTVPYSTEAATQIDAMMKRTMREEAQKLSERFHTTIDDFLEIEQQHGQ